jgi:hypothetical protein
LKRKVGKKAPVRANVTNTSFATKSASHNRTRQAQADVHRIALNAHSCG